MRKWKKWVIPALANRNMKCAMYLNLVATFQMLNSHMWIVSLRDNSETENINIPIYYEHKNGSWKPVTNVRSGDKVAEMDYLNLRWEVGWQWKIKVLEMSRPLLAVQCSRRRMRNDDETMVKGLRGRFFYRAQSYFSYVERNIRL